MMMVMVMMVYLNAKPIGADTHRSVAASLDTMLTGPGISSSSSPSLYVTMMLVMAAVMAVPRVCVCDGGKCERCVISLKRRFRNSKKEEKLIRLYVL